MTLKFALEPGGEQRIEIAWRLAWRNFTIKFDDTILYQANVSSKQLAEGIHVLLPDDSLLTVKFKASSIATSFDVLRDGIPLPTATPNPETAVKLASSLMYVLAAINIVIGVIAVFGTSPFFDQLGLTWVSLVFGITFAVLAYLVRTRHSSTALGVGIAVWGVDTLLTVIASFSASADLPIGGIFMRGFFLYFMIQGFAALRNLKRDDPRPV